MSACGRYAVPTFARKRGKEPNLPLARSAGGWGGGDEGSPDAPGNAHCKWGLATKKSKWSIKRNSR